MASKRSEPQQEERPAAEDDGRAGRDEGYAIDHAEDRGETYGGADVLLDVPKLNVEEVDLEVEDLQVRVSLQAALADLVQINVGLEAELGEVKLVVKGIEAQAQLKARLDNVRAIFSEVLATLEHSPQFFRQVLESANEARGDREGSTANAGVVDEVGDVVRPPSDGNDEEPDEPESTEAARKKAVELGIDLSGIEGSGSGGRILVRDVTRAARG
jgi:pyruvate/2-oxoglutarate dehydrogenase complex dihydrolipoamide acyltransferase (E2) component